MSFNNRGAAGYSKKANIGVGDILFPQDQQSRNYQEQDIDQRRQLQSQLGSQIQSTYNSQKLLPPIERNRS